MKDKNKIKKPKGIVFILAFHSAFCILPSALPFILTPVLAFWLSLTLAPYCATFWDSGIYVSMGNSIAKGNGSTYLGYAFKYPPVFPLMLALIIIPFGYNFLLMRLLMVACATGALWLAYLIVRDRCNRWIATGVMVATAFSYPILFECTRILSDLPYMFFSLLAVYWIERYARNADSWRNRAGYIAAGLMVVAYFTRIVGLTLFAAAIAYLVLGGAHLPPSRQNLKKAMAVGAILVIAAPLWPLYNHLSGDKYPVELRQGVSYGKELLTLTTERPDAPTIDWNALGERLKENSRYYAGLLANIVTGKRQPFIPREQENTSHWAWFITFVWLAGYALCVIRYRSFLEYYTFFYLFIYLLWPAHQRERFLVPIIPFLLYYLFRLLEQIVSGIRWLIQRLFSQRDPERVIDAMAVMLAVGVFIQSNWTSDAGIIRDERREPYYTGRYGVLIHLVRWLNENTPDDTVIITSEPAFVQILFEKSAPRNITNRKAFDFPWATDSTRLLEFINRLGVDYIISAPSGRAKTYLHPVLEQHPDRFEEVHRLGNYIIYQALPSAEF